MTGAVEFGPEPTTTVARLNEGGGPHAVEHHVVTNERDVAAIVAHGLLNSLAVITTSAGTLISFGDSLSATEVDKLLLALMGHGEVFNEGLGVLLRHSSQAFADAATVLALAAVAIGSVDSADRAEVLTGIVDAGKTLRHGLESLVRGLPQEVIDALDAMQRR